MPTCKFKDKASNDLKAYCEHRVAVKVINILADNDVPIQEIDTIVNFVKQEVSQQIIQPTEIIHSKNLHIARGWKDGRKHIDTD